MHRCLAIAFLGLMPLGASAGPFQDELSKCLVVSTTPDDRSDLVRWIFAAASAHPAVSSVVTVSVEQRSTATQKVGELFMRLLTDSCRKQTQEAINFEGEQTLRASFEALGRLAGQEMFSSPEVAGVMAELQQHLDEKKLQEAFGKTP